jgi:hypothetical protein
MMTILSNEVCEYKYCFEIYKVDWVIAQWINVRENQSGYQECTNSVVFVHDISAESVKCNTNIINYIDIIYKIHILYFLIYIPK